MSKQELTFGILLELVEDWVHRESLDSKIKIRIVDGEDVFEMPVGGAYLVPKEEKIVLLAKTPNEGDLFNEFGVLVNGESPNWMLSDLQEIEDKGIDHNTPVGIEVWFKDKVDGELQFIMESHSFSIKENDLFINYFFTEEKDELADEFHQLLHSQYSKSNI